MVGLLLAVLGGRPVPAQQVGDLTNPERLGDTTSPGILTNPSGLSLPQHGSALGGVDKICAAAAVVQPFGPNPAPPSVFPQGGTPAERWCAIRLKILLDRACKRLPDKLRDGEIVRGDLKPPRQGDGAAGYTVPDVRLPGGATEYNQPTDDNIIVIPADAWDAATGSFKGTQSLAARHHLLATTLFHEYLHCLEDSGGDACKEFRDHALIFKFMNLLDSVLIATCGMPGGGGMASADFQAWRMHMQSWGRFETVFVAMGDLKGWPVQ